MAFTAVAAGAVASVGSGILGGIGAGKAAKAQADAYNRQLQFDQGVYSTAQTNLQPWISGGQQALQGMETFLGLPGGGGPAGSGALASFNQFTQTPYYTFPLRQNVDTMNRQAAAKGTSLSLGQLGDLGRMAGGYASSNFMQYISALNSLSGLGASTAGNLGNIGANIANVMNPATAGLANANANAAAAPYAMGANILGSLGGLVQNLSGYGPYGAAASLAQSGSSYGGGGGPSTWPSTITNSPYGGTFYGSSPAPMPAGNFNSGLGATY